MTIELSPEETRIAQAFYARYDPLTQLLRQMLDRYDETEYRQQAAIIVPFAADFLEGKTREEMYTFLISLTIGAGVAAAVQEAVRIARESTTWPA